MKKVNLKDYRNIIFDLGGVILNLNYQLTIEAFKKLGLPNFDANYTQLSQTALFDSFERGEIAPIEFRKGLKEVFGGPIADEELDLAWNAMLLDLPFERLHLLDRIRQGNKLVLLSNTNEIHVEAFETSLKIQHGQNDLSNYFETVYYSCRVGMRKPEARIFHHVLDSEGFSPSETLFIDDSPQHIEGARKVGLHTYHLRADKGETILDLF
ncbi:MAG: putative hydrolase of the HAD superfamily [Bacteroidia bacterium]|jgi:FMN phosphatase YigB (HAD superfamily)